MIYLQGEGKGNFLSAVSGGGIFLLSLCLLLWEFKCNTTGWIKQFREFFRKVDNDQKLGTQPSPNFTSC